MLRPWRTGSSLRYWPITNRPRWAVAAICLIVAVLPTPSINGEVRRTYVPLLMTAVASYWSWPFGALNLLIEVLVCAGVALLVNRITARGSSHRVWAPIGSACVLGVVAGIGIHDIVLLFQAVKYYVVMLAVMRWLEHVGSKVKSS